MATILRSPHLARLVPRILGCAGVALLALLAILGNGSSPALGATPSAVCISRTGVVLATNTSNGCAKTEKKFVLSVLAPNTLCITSSKSLKYAAGGGCAPGTTSAETKIQTSGLNICTKSSTRQVVWRSSTSCPKGFVVKSFRLQPVTITSLVTATPITTSTESIIASESSSTLPMETPTSSTSTSSSSTTSSSSSTTSSSSTIPPTTTTTTTSTTTTVPTTTTTSTTTTTTTTTTSTTTTTTTTPPSTTTTTVAPSSIALFFSGVPTINEGQTTYLWTSYTGVSGSVDHGVGAIQNALAIDISPTVTTTYKLTVTNGAGHTTTATVTVTVIPAAGTTTTTTTTTVPPSSIALFFSGVPTINEGQTTYLWTSYTGVSGSVDHGVGAIQNALAIDISPTVTTTYTLTVTNGAGHTTTATVTVTVVPANGSTTTTTQPPTSSTTTTTVAPPSSITYFFGGTSTINEGDSTYLWAYFSGTTATVDQGIGTLPNAQAVTVSPTVTTTYTLTVSNGAGHTTTATTTIIVIPAASTSTTSTSVPGSSTSSTTTTTTVPSGNIVSITNQPANATPLLGSTNTFSVTATGNGSLSYQWYFNDVAIASAQSATYVAADEGNYKVVVTNSYNGTTATVTSRIASLTIRTAVITSQPVDTYVSSGFSKFLNVGVSSAGDIVVTYQWYRDGSPVNGATSQSYSASVAGTYTLMVTSTRLGQTAVKVSNEAVVTVVANPVITNFRPDRTTVAVGDSTTFTPQFTGGVGVINPGNVTVTSGQPIALTLTTTTTFQLTVTNLAGSSATLSSTVTTTTGTIALSANGSSADRTDGSTSVTLTDGRVLVFGSYFNFGTLATDTYDPATNQFTRVGDLNEARIWAPGVRLNNGKVLVVGGSYYTGTDWSARSTAELFDPSTNTWSYTTGTPGTSRRSHFMVLLPNGKVFIGGGFSASGASLSTTEIFDPATGTFTAAAPMGEGISGATAVLLPNGNVLVAGGLNPYLAPLNYARIYVVANNTWTTVTSHMNHARSGAQAVVLNDGRVLIAGGFDRAQGLAYMEIFDPATNTFAPDNSLSHFLEGRGGLTLHVLQDGRVAFIGGTDGFSTIQSEIAMYNPATNMMQAEATHMYYERYQHSSALLNDGRIFIMGKSWNWAADIFTP